MTATIRSIEAVVLLEALIRCVEPRRPSSFGAFSRPTIKGA
jgi:hypothetical protein